MADEENKKETYIEALQRLGVCTHHQANANIVDRTEAYDYLNTHDLKVIFNTELNDGTPRRVWLLMDPAGHSCGRLYTAIGDLGYANKDKYEKDLFDFMEIFIHRQDYKKGDKDNYPRTGHFMKE